MPDVEVAGPQDEGDDRVEEEAKAVDDRQAQHRRENRPGQAECDQQRADVADHQVLCHVDREEVAGRVAEAPDGEDGHQEPAEHAGLPPAGHVAGGPAQVPDPDGVERRHDDRGQELERREGIGRQESHNRLDGHA